MRDHHKIFITFKAVLVLVELPYKFKQCFISFHTLTQAHYVQQTAS